MRHRRRVAVAFAVAVGGGSAGGSVGGVAIGGGALGCERDARAHHGLDLGGAQQRGLGWQGAAAAAQVVAAEQPRLAARAPRVRRQCRQRGDLLRRGALVEELCVQLNHLALRRRRLARRHARRLHSIGGGVGVGGVGGGGVRVAQERGERGGDVVPRFGVDEVGGREALEPPPRAEPRARRGCAAVG